MANKQYKVAALVSTYNSEKYFRSCLENLLSQTLASQLQIIIINSGSEQNEEAIAQEFQQLHENITYCRTEREMLYGAWNRSIQLAQADYLISANTDDRLHPDALYHMATALDNRAEIGLVYADTFLTQKTSDVLGPLSWEKPSSNWIRITRPDYQHKTLLMQNYCGPQPMWRKTLHSQFGLFDESFRVAGDYEFWLRIAEHVPFFHLSDPGCLGLFLEHPHSIEQLNPELLATENQLIALKYFWHRQF
jgi:O-antigen biosynthesis protein